MTVALRRLSPLLEADPRVWLPWQTRLLPKRSITHLRRSSIMLQDMRADEAMEAPQAHASDRSPTPRYAQSTPSSHTRPPHSRHAPADWIVHATMIGRSWDGLRTRQIAEELGCYPQTVRERLHAFNARGLDGLGMPPGSGRSGRPPRRTGRPGSTSLKGSWKGSWRRSRRKACAGVAVADADDIAAATRVATAHLNRRATPWI